MVERLSDWLVNTALFEQAWAVVCVELDNWWWSEQLCLFTAGPWTVFLFLECAVLFTWHQASANKVSNSTKAGHTSCMGLHAPWAVGCYICCVELVLHRNPHGRFESAIQVARPGCATMGVAPSVPITSRHLALSSGSRNKWISSKSAHDAFLTHHSPPSHSSYRLR